MIQSAPFIPFSQSAASQQVPPPYHFPDVTVNAFVWEADMLAVQRYCDRFFNLGSKKDRGFVYKPASFWPYATLLFLEYPVMISSAKKPPSHEIAYSDRGTISQTEVFIALPVARYGTTPAKFIAETELEWALPFIVVGNSMSAVCGREMLGLGKLIADITTTEGEFPNSFRGGIKLPGWPSCEPGVPMENMPFLDVTTGPALPTFRMKNSPKKSLATLFDSRVASRFIESQQTLANFIDVASIGLLPTAMRTVGLKQYRDAQNREKAIYQALVTCRSHYSNVRGFRLYDEKDVSILFQDTGSFNVGLQDFLNVGPTASNKSISIDPVAAFKFNADIDYDQMRVTHNFAVDRGNGLPPTASSSDLTSRWMRPWKGFFGTGPQT